jgi:class 3 adenylate cyclase
LVEHDAPLSEWELPLREGLPPSQTRIIGSERQRIVLSNDFDHEVVARIEKTVGREDAVTAAEAACSPLFRRLFPSEVLAPGHLIAVSKITLLLIEVCDVWQSEEPEAMAFARLADLQHKAEEIVAKDNGAIVKIVGDGVLASFSEPTNALRAGFAMLESGDASRMRMAMHAGAVMATSINDRLDYFGRIVSETSSLLAAASRGTLVVSEALYVDPGVSAMLAAQRRGTEMVQTEGVVGQALSA